MYRSNHYPSKSRLRANSVARATSRQQSSQRVRSRAATRSENNLFSPPEDWYEPQAGVEGYQVYCQSPGPGYVHAVNEQEIRDRLAQLPGWMIQPLQVVQLSRMTRKKLTLPCYGMQWGASLYLYPIEDSLVEVFADPPKPAVFMESRQFGGRWIQSDGMWTLRWTQRTLRDFYLNNILIHELGHLLDQRNSSYVDRERYAEWFAIEFGYKPTRATRRPKRRRQQIRRRHHSC